MGDGYWKWGIGVFDDEEIFFDLLIGGDGGPREFGEFVLTHGSVCDFEGRSGFTEFGRGDGVGGCGAVGEGGAFGEEFRVAAFEAGEQVTEEVFDVIHDAHFSLEGCSN